MPLTVLEDDLFAESQETKDYPIKPSQYRNPECPLLLEKPEWKTVQIFKHIHWRQYCFGNKMPLLLTLARHWFDSGANTFQVISRCQPAHAALMRGVHAPLRHYLSLKNRFFFLFTPCETPQGLLNAASQEQQPQQ